VGKPVEVELRDVDPEAGRERRRGVLAEVNDLGATVEGSSPDEGGPASLTFYPWSSILGMRFVRNPLAEVSEEELEEELEELLEEPS
jgi:hypothetical protein